MNWTSFNSFDHLYNYYSQQYFDTENHIKKRDILDTYATNSCYTCQYDNDL
jgi:hypothetical protein